MVSDNCYTKSDGSPFCDLATLVNSSDSPARGMGRTPIIVLACLYSLLFSILSISVEHAKIPSTFITWRARLFSPHTSSRIPPIVLHHTSPRVCQAQCVISSNHTATIMSESAGPILARPFANGRP